MFKENAVPALRLLFFLCAAATFSQEPAICKKIRNNYTGEKTIRINFEQSIFWTVREKTTRKKGTVTIAPGNRFNVEFGDETLISDGSTYWQFSRKNKQVIIRNVEDLDLSSLPSSILTNFLNNFTFREKERKGKTTILEWLPDTSSEQSYKNVTLSVTAASGTVESLTFTDKNSNIHRYNFKKTVFKKTVPAKTFHFKAPADVTIIDNRS